MSYHINIWNLLYKCILLPLTQDILNHVLSDVDIFMGALAAATEAKGGLNKKLKKMKKSKKKGF